MNNKGFTMIELLASMVLLSILMLTAVPTVLGVMDDSRKTTILNDSKKFVANVEYKLKHNNNYIKKPRSTAKEQGNCILMTLGYLDLGTDFKEGPHGGYYSTDDSYVVVKLSEMGNAGEGKVQTYKFYVTLVEVYNGSIYGLYLVPFESLDDGKAKSFVSGLTNDKLFSKKATLPKELTGNEQLTGKNEVLGCNHLSNTNDRSTDTVYDEDDALREQGVSDEDINTPATNP